MTNPTRDLILLTLKVKQISLRKLAKESGVSYSTLSRIVKGKIKGTRVNTYIKILNYKKKPEEYTRTVYLAPGFEPLRNTRAWYD